MGDQVGQGLRKSEIPPSQEEGRRPGPAMEHQGRVLGGPGAGLRPGGSYHPGKGLGKSLDMGEELRLHILY